MTMGDTINNNSVQLNVKDGVATIEQGTALTRLHYFDGKFLRADALTLEQDYHRMLVRLSNLAGGWGVVHGLGISMSGASLSVSPGLAITPAGSTVLLSSAISVEVAKLIAAASPAPANPVTPGVVGSANFGNCGCAGPDSISTTLATGYYEITVGPVEGLCGNEEVYGKLCEDACVTDSQSPYWKEGLILRLRPITLNLLTSTAVPPAAMHLRNRVASAYFASEPWLTASLLSAAGLNSTTWCNPAQLYNRDEVPIGLLVHNGTSTQFIDAWSARRERMDTQARSYWQGRMMMRPWNVFLAQILQFQCQLAGSFGSGGTPPEDQCDDLRQLLASSLRELELVQLNYAQSSERILKMLGENGMSSNEGIANDLKGPSSKLAKLSKQLAQAQLGFGSLPSNRLLINSGFMELPPAGYLPVDPASQPINEQLKRMFGEGVRLFFCSARPDFIPHAVEEAQHMERISLTRGLDDPSKIEDVEIFVPHGQLMDALSPENGTHWEVAASSQLFMRIFAGLGLLKKEMEMEADAAAPAAAAGGANPSTTSNNSTSGGSFGNREIDRIVGMSNRLSRGVYDTLNQSGVARTTQLDSGGAAITLVCGPKAAPVYGTNQPAEDVTAQYYDLRITQDPFARQEGDQVPVDVEIRLSGTTKTEAGTEVPVGEIITGSGKLTIQAIYPVDNQTMAIDGVMDLRLSLDLVPDSPELADVIELLQGERRAVLPVTIQRQGDSKSGRTLVMPTDTGANRLRIGWLAAWQGQPRNAVFGMYANRNAMVGEAPSYTHLEEVNYSVNDVTPVMIEAPTPENFIALLQLDELTVALQPESPLRLNALNLLSGLATATEDPAFLTRARRLLFPEALSSNGELLIRATLDWVMFRRRRKAICDTSCACPTVPETTLQAFQTWHVRLDNDDALDTLLAAIDEDDEEAIKQFDFQRVDVLHYANASQSPTETLNQVVSDWQAVNPGSHVILGRVWEEDPQSGQMAQNQARLKRLTTLLSTVTAPPPNSQLKAMNKAPQAVSDSNFDGGMLLATLGSVATTHRVYMVPQNEADIQRQIITQGGAGIVARLEKYAIYKTTLPVDSNNALSAADSATLKDAFDNLEPVQSFAIELISLAGVGDEASIGKRHQAVLDAVGIQASAGGSVFKVAEATFPTTSGGATVVYLINDIIA